MIFSEHILGIKAFFCSEGGGVITPSHCQQGSATVLELQFAQVEQRLFGIQRTNLQELGWQ